MSDPITASEKQAASGRDGLDDSNISSSYAFLVHSQTTIPGNLPPNVDNKALARQKRRRTSPEDHAILEEEYQWNPKPDKAARIELVNRVALGEKEVQASLDIWFQNRRQNDRRKSRPLQPHEVFRASPFRLYSHNPPPASSKSSTVQVQTTVATQQRHSDDGLVADTGPIFLEVACSALSQSSPPLPNSTNSSFQSTNDSVSDQDDSQNSTICSTGDATIQAVPIRRERPTSMRLSMSLDGNAVITANTDHQISPPKYRQGATSISAGRVGSLKRSQSAVTLGEIEPLAVPRLSEFSRRSSFGRSRDSRTWEFYCDGDSRDALTAQAERENRGSAAGAISLIRSRSNSALQNSNTRSLKNPNLKPSSQSHRKSKLGRATSSVARLQSCQSNVKPLHPNTNEKALKLNKKESSLGSPTGDSDKENWIPGTQISNTPRRQGQSGRAAKRPVLNENRQILSQSSGLEAFLQEEARQTSRKNRGSSDEDKENAIEQEEDEEVESFMKGTQHTTGGEDFDCIQGLLSLSQGAWR